MTQKEIKLLKNHLPGSNSAPRTGYVVNAIAKFSVFKNWAKNGNVRSWPVSLTTPDSARLSMVLPSSMLFTPQP